MNSNSKINKICCTCNRILADSDEECPFCGVGVEQLDFADYSKHPWVLVYTTNTQLDAEMYKANLEGAGIPVNILSQVDTSRMLTVGELAIVKIYVKSPFVTLAEEIIKEINSQNCI